MGRMSPPDTTGGASKCVPEAALRALVMDAGRMAPAYAGSGAKKILTAEGCYGNVILLVAQPPLDKAQNTVTPGEGRLPSPDHRTIVPGPPAALPAGGLVFYGPPVDRPHHRGCT